MSGVITDLGTGMSWTPEIFLIQVLNEGMLSLIGDAPRMAEVVRRQDVDDRGVADQWERDLRRDIEDMVAGTDRQGPPRIMLGYPNDHTVFPAVSVVIASGAQDAGKDVAGSILSLRYEHKGEVDADNPTGSRTVEHAVTGHDWSTTLEVGAWALAAESATLLHAVIKHVLLHEKGRLHGAGIYDVSLTETGFQPGEGWGRIGFVPIIRCSMTWTMRSTRRKGPVPTRVTFSTVKGCT